MGAALFEQRLEQSEQIIVKVQPKMQHRLYGNGIKQSQSLLNRAGVRPNKPALAKLYPTEIPDNGTVNLTRTTVVEHRQHRLAGGSGNEIGGTTQR
jgi:hypothetical protein